MARRYNYITFTYARVCVCNCVCYEPIELYVSIFVCVLPLEGMSHWSLERTNKYIRIGMTNQDTHSAKRWYLCLLFSVLVEHVVRYSATSQYPHEAAIHNRALLLWFQEGCACACVYPYVFVSMHLQGGCCNACGLSVLKPRCCVKEQQCLRSPICLIQAWNAMPFNDKILSGWEVCRKGRSVCVCLWVSEWVSEGVCVVWVWNREE